LDQALWYQPAGPVVTAMVVPKPPSLGWGNPDDNDREESGRTISRLPKLRGLANQALGSAWLVVLITQLNIASCVLVALETDCHAMVWVEGRSGHCPDGAEDVFLIMECVFLSAFVAELATNILVDSRYLKTGWGKFDAFVVLVWMANAAVVQPLFAGLAWAGMFGVARALRGLRLLRLNQSLSRMMRLPKMWAIGAGLITTIRAVAWALSFGALSTFLFAAAGVGAFAASLGAGWASVGQAMLTLWQVALSDSSRPTIVEPVVERFPVTGHIYFALYFVVILVTLLSLVTGVLTDCDFLEQARGGRGPEDQDGGRALELQRALNNLKKLFLHKDVTREELRNLWEVDEAAHGSFQAFGSLEELLELFDLITGGDARVVVVDCTHFLENMLQYKTDRAAFLAMLTHQQVRAVRRQVMSIEHQVEASHARQLEIVTSSSCGRAEIWSEFQEEQEHARQLEDQHRAERLKRLGLPDAEITQMRRAFEAADAAHFGELYFEKFAGLFPKGQKNGLWSSCTLDPRCRINFDEFLDLASRHGGARMLRAVAGRERLQKARSQQIQVEKGSQLREEEVRLLVAEAANAAAERIADRLAGPLFGERLAECVVPHVESCIAQYSADRTASDRVSSEAFAAYVADFQKLLDAVRSMRPPPAAMRAPAVAPSSTELSPHETDAASAQVVAQRMPHFRRSRPSALSLEVIEEGQSPQRCDNEAPPQTPQTPLRPAAQAAEPAPASRQRLFLPAVPAPTSPAAPPPQHWLLEAQPQATAGVPSQNLLPQVPRYPAVVEATPIQEALQQGTTFWPDATLRAAAGAQNSSLSQEGLIGPELQATQSSPQNARWLLQQVLSPGLMQQPVPMHQGLSPNARLGSLHSANIAARLSSPTGRHCLLRQVEDVHRQVSSLDQAEHFGRLSPVGM